MQTITLNPRFEVLNRYFHYYKTKEEYIEEEEFCDWDELKIASYYDSHKKHEINSRLKKVMKIETEIYVNDLSKLCHESKLSDFTDDILFASLDFLSQIPYYEKLSFSVDRIKEATLENYKMLKDIFDKKERLHEIHLRIGKPKKKKKQEQEQNHKKKNGALIISDYQIISKVLVCIEEHILANLSTFLFAEEPLTDKDFNIKSIESKIGEIERLRYGRKPGLTPRIASFVINLHEYLENETPLKAEQGTTLSSAQCNFMFDLLCILKITDYSEKFRGLYKSEYIWNLFNNERKRWEKSKSRTK